MRTDKNGLFPSAYVQKQDNMKKRVNAWKADHNKDEAMGKGSYMVWHGSLGPLTMAKRFPTIWPSNLRAFLAIPQPITYRVVKFSFCIQTLQKSQRYFNLYTAKWSWINWNRSSALDAKIFKHLRFLGNESQYVHYSKYSEMKRNCLVRQIKVYSKQRGSLQALRSMRSNLRDRMGKTLNDAYLKYFTVKEKRNPVKHKICNYSIGTKKRISKSTN